MKYKAKPRYCEVTFLNDVIVQGGCTNKSIKHPISKSCLVPLFRNNMAGKGVRKGGFGVEIPP